MSAIHRITVLGRDLNVKSTADEDAVRKIEAFVNDRVDRVLNSGKTSDSQMAIILAFLNVAEEYLSMQRKVQDGKAADDGRIAGLISRLDGVAD